MRPTGLQMFEYAERFTKKSESLGRGTQWPTLRQSAKRFRTTIAEIEDVVAGGVDLPVSANYYFGIAVAVGIPGVGSARFSSRGECQIEAYRDVPEVL